MSYLGKLLERRCDNCYFVQGIKRDGDTGELLFYCLVHKSYRGEFAECEYWTPPVNGASGSEKISEAQKIRSEVGIERRHKEALRNTWWVAIVSFFLGFISAYLLQVLL